MRQTKSLPTRTPDRAIYKPRLPGQELASRKAKFDKLHKVIDHRGGWVTSIPGEAEIRFETLPGSGLPAELKAAGYDLRSDGHGERILASAITERLVLSSSGALVPLTPES